MVRLQNENWVAEFKQGRIDQECEDKPRLEGPSQQTKLMYFTETMVNGIRSAKYTAHAWDAVGQSVYVILSEDLSMRQFHQDGCLKQKRSQLNISRERLRQFQANSEYFF